MNFSNILLFLILHSVAIHCNNNKDILNDNEYPSGLKKELSTLQTTNEEYLDHILIGYLLLFQKKIENNTLTGIDEKLLDYIMTLCFERYKKIAEEKYKSRPIVYWYSRQGRDAFTHSM
jgi:hypothetical protein